MKTNFLLSVVIPIHNEEHNIEALFKRLIPLLSRYQYEIITIDDGSTDNTYALLKKEAGKNKQIKVLSFTRNFGHQVALSCGYSHATGDCTVTIDADLQDPPEIIPELIKKWQEGADLVYAKRKKRDDSIFKRVTAFIFYRCLNFLSDIPIPTDVGDYRLQDKKVNDFLKNLPEHNKFYRGLAAWGGFREEVVEFNRDKRFAGTTHYTLSKMINFALDGIVSFSVKPLRLATYTGFLASLLGFTGILYALFIRFFMPHQYWVTGWTALFVAVLFIGGAQLVTIGIIGEYTGKIYREVQNRPQYLLKDKINV
ncbi:MAG: glycosyltransferase [Patescibacteria group bacterium]|jgi:dolichol-phosphate mannosyltransferase